CDANGEPLSAARQRAVLRFDDEVDVIVLNGKVNDAKDAFQPARGVRGLNAAHDLSGDDGLSERRKTAARAHRDVNGMRPTMPLTRTMPRVRTNAARPPSVVPGTTMVEHLQRKLFHLNRAYIMMIRPNATSQVVLLDESVRRHPWPGYG